MSVPITRACLCCCLALGFACSPGNPPIADTGGEPFVFDCEGDNDGSISASELPVATGLSVPYLANAAGTTVVTDPHGQQDETSTTWDFTSAPGTLTVDFPMLDPGGLWFDSHFPDADFAAPLFAHEPLLLGVISASEHELSMLGLASREEAPAEGQTLVVYDQPVKVYDLPLELGTQWESSGSFNDAVIAGVPNAGLEDYSFEVDAIGTLLLPGYALENTLRLHVELTQTFAVSSGDNTVESQRYLYLRECFGELARITSLPGETSPDFVEASELRVLDVEG